MMGCFFPKNHKQPRKYGDTKGMNSFATNPGVFSYYFIQIAQKCKMIFLIVLKMYYAIVMNENSGPNLHI